jgi:VWFA-related protein
MSMSGWALSRVSCVTLFFLASLAGAQQNPGPTTDDHTPVQMAPNQSHPELSRRPTAVGSPDGKIHLDVLVTDGAGRPIAGLREQDFTLFDDNKPQPILSFREVDGAVGTGGGEPPVEVILLVDVTNTSLRVVGYERSQIENFLRRNGGKLTHPTSVMIFSEQGVKGQPQPTMDGNRLADDLKKAETTVHTVPFTIEHDPDRLRWSLNALQLIIQAEAKRPGRTILLWIGDGWPMLESSLYQFTKRNYQGQFDQVVTTSNGLRESRITLYSIYPIDPGSTDERPVQHYRSFLKGVPSVNQVRPGDLALPVLAIHSGGRALDSPGELGDEIAACIAEAKAYYTLTFDRATAKHIDEYHELAVHLDQRQLRARTSVGYYAEPLFQFQLPTLSATH